jgi:hypothetical protein
VVARVPTAYRQAVWDTGNPSERIQVAEQHADWSARANFVFRPSVPEASVAFELHRNGMYTGVRDTYPLAPHQHNQPPRSWLMGQQSIFEADAMFSSGEARARGAVLMQVKWDPRGSTGMFFSTVTVPLRREEVKPDRVWTAVREGTPFDDIVIGLKDKRDGNGPTATLNDGTFPHVLLPGTDRYFDVTRQFGPPDHFTAFWVSYTGISADGKDSDMAD